MTRKKFNLILSLIAFILFFCGLYISEDYGISVDEDARRKGGLSFVKYISQNIGYDHPRFDYVHDYQEYRNAWMAPYGMIFEIPASIIQNFFNIDEKEEIFLFRHKFTFLFYFIGVLFFFAFSKEILNSKNKAVIATLIYCLHPRIFGHSFFNPKDIIFLSTVSMSLYPGIKFLKTESVKWGIVSAVFYGIVMSTRIVGLYLPFLNLIIFGVNRFILDKVTYSVFRSYLFKSIIFMGVSFIVLFILTPYYWENSFSRFIETFTIAKNFPWNGNNFFFGNYISAVEQNPWYYLIVWFIITTPIIFLIFFIVGIITIIQNTFKSFERNIYYIFCIFAILIPIIISILFGSTLYDGWRHFYFLFTFCSIIITVGIFWIINSIKLFSFNPLNIPTIMLFLIIYSAPLFSIIKMHPYQQVYFNFIAGKDPMKYFEGDYWGTTYREGFEWIGKNTPEDTLRIWLGSGFGKGIGLSWKNYWFLDKGKREKLIIVDFNEPKRKLIKHEYIMEADYLMTNFRGSQDSYYEMSKLGVFPFEDEVFSIKKGGMKLLGIYKL